MTKYINRYFFLLLLIALSACKVSKDIATPQPALPVSFRNDAVSDSSSIADIQWKDFFKEPELLRLIDSAIAKNYDMQLAVKNIQEAQLLFKQTKWGYVPSVNLNITANLNRPSDNSLNGITASQFLGSTHIEDFSANLGLSWEADIWGKVRNQKRAAFAQYLQSAEVKKLVQTNLVANVSQGFYNLLMLDAQLDVARKNLALNDSTLRIIQLQYNAGQVTSLAIQQAEALQQTSAALVPQIEQDITIQENALSVLTGELPAKINRNTMLDQVATSNALAAGVPTAMVSRRPDVKSYELALTVANARVGITKAAMYPSLVITASGGLNSFKTENWFNIPASLFGIVGGGITQPLLQRRQLKTQYEVAKVEREKAVIQFRQAVLLAVGDVSNALVRIEKLKEQQTIAAKRVNTLHQATANANMLFKNGMATYLEVITAQGNVLQSELNLTAIKRAQLSATVELYRSLGGGW